MEPEFVGCWLEAQRCDRVALELLRLRNDLLPFHEQISTLLREVETTSRLLRDLHDLLKLYISRSPIVVYYLHVILPCLSRTLRDMMIYLKADQLPCLAQWTLMVERLSDQGGMPLVHRIVLYIEYLVQIVRLLSRFL